MLHSGQTVIPASARFFKRPRMDADANFRPFADADVDTLQWSREFYVMRRTPIFYNNDICKSYGK